MKNILSGLVLLGLILPNCGHKAPLPTETNLSVGKHELLKNDPRSWNTYPVVVLVAVKHQVGIDTVAQLVHDYDVHFRGMLGPYYEAQLPAINFSRYEEDTKPTSADVRLLTAEGKRYGLMASQVADIISDFYIIGGSNRDYPDSGK